MKTPFTLEVPEFKPREHLDANPNIPKDQRRLLDAIDVLEQKIDFSISTTAKNHLTIMIIVVILIATNGPQIGSAIGGILQRFVSERATAAAVDGGK